MSETPRPRLLDLFCGAGGASAGYERAGFDVVGIDIEPQPSYPFEFHQADALEVLDALCGVRQQFGHMTWHDAVHASPPCQFRTAYKRRPGHVAPSPNLIPAVRGYLDRLGLPYVIENVEQARDQLRDPVRLCGSAFGLHVRRHRLFECSFPVMVPDCDHGWQAHGPRFPGATNRAENSRHTVEVGVWRIPLEVQQRAMGIHWMTLPELSQAIPPAYTEHIGSFLAAEVNRRTRLVA
jgi:DNA (cytosine-5)-methyltransferase 1